jgi:hypothetical protein
MGEEHCIMLVPEGCSWTCAKLEGRELDVFSFPAVSHRYLCSCFEHKERLPIGWCALIVSDHVPCRPEISVPSALCLHGHLALTNFLMAMLTSCHDARDIFQHPSSSVPFPYFIINHRPVTFYPLPPPPLLNNFITSWRNFKKFNSQQGRGSFLFSTASRPTLGPNQRPIQWVLEALSLEIKRSGREADHSLPCSDDIKNVWSYTSTPHTSSWRDA